VPFSLLKNTHTCKKQTACLGISSAVIANSTARPLRYNNSFELAHTAGIEGDDLSVQDSALRLEAGQHVPQYFEALVRVSSARGQTAPPAFEVGQRPETVVFQLENSIRIVEGLQGTGLLRWLDFEQHLLA